MVEFRRPAAARSRLPTPAPQRLARDKSGRPLTGLCQEAIAFRRNPSVAFTFQAQLPATRLPADSNRTRFLALLAANRIAPVTHQVQACRDVLRPPWQRWPPQRNVGAKPCPKGWSHLCGCRDGDASPQRAHGLGDSVICTPSDGTKTASNHSRWLCTRPLSGSPPLAKPLHETALHVEGLLLTQHVVARPREFVRDRLERHDAVALALLALIEALGLRAITQREVGGLHKGPGEVLVAVLGVAFALLLAIALTPAVHTATVGAEIAHAGKARDRPRLQHDRGGQRLTDAGHRLQQTIFRSQLHPLFEPLLQHRDLLL